MTGLPRRGLWAPLALATFAVLAASCGPNETPAPSPIYGGTLKLLGASDVDHLDTASAYYTATYTLERAFARQLVTYPAATDFTAATQIVADAAASVPTVANSGISADLKTYTFHIRQGVMWNTTPARQVTSQDFLLGLKRLCNPASPVGAPGYYTATIVGFNAYCNAFGNVSATDAGAMKTFIDSNQISGITTPDSMTIVFQLLSPASDFLNILALPFASAAPVEYESYVPDGNDFRSHTVSDGPYEITKYNANTEIDLDHNPAWTQASDPARHQYVNNIVVTEGSNETAVQQQLQAGTSDLEWDTSVPTASIPGLQAAKDPNFGIFASPDTNPYMVFNFQSPNNNKALQNVAVRQALEYAIDKTALGKIYGGSALNTPLNQVIPPGNLGYQQFNLYPTPNDAGDATKCKSLLATAGFPNGLTLKDAYRSSGKHPAVFQVVQQDFANCGVTVQGTQVSGADFYGKYLNNVANSAAGNWDIAEPGWVPDWFGNNGRSITEPLFDGRTYGPNSTDYGDYNSATVNSDIDKALAAADSATAANFWHAADQQIMQDAAFIPFQTQSTPLYHSSRTANAIFAPFSQSFDVTQVWLSS